MFKRKAVDSENMSEKGISILNQVPEPCGLTQIVRLLKTLGDFFFFDSLSGCGT